MSLPKKGLRRIVVDCQRYRWTVRKSPSYAQALANSPLTFAVEAAEESGSVLYVKLARVRPDNWLELSSSPPITPAEVARFIRQALQSGWDPIKPGSAFEINEQQEASNGLH